MEETLSNYRIIPRSFFMGLSDTEFTAISNNKIGTMHNFLNPGKLFFTCQHGMIEIKK